MSDEKNGIKNGGANNEDMAPQEDGTKVPLTADGVEVKFSSNDASGDAKIDMPGTTHVFSGLTKEELMQYANDPFWKKMRWFLFISFWLAWIAMLVAAIVIIVLAPRCTPPLHWMQDSAIMSYDQNKVPDMNADELQNAKDVVETAKQLNMTAIYIPGLISDKDFSKPAEGFTDIEALLKDAKDAKLDVVTDFVKSVVPSDNVWVTSKPGFFASDLKLDFSKDDVRTELQTILESWIQLGVKGFFMNEKDETKIKEFLNEGIADTEGLVVTDVMDMSDVLSPFTVNKYREFLKANAKGNDLTWNWFKYNPTAGKTSGLSEDLANLVTLSLYTAPGTPVLEGLDSQADINNEAEILKYISPLRKQQVMHFSNTSWTDTVENVISFARYLHGTTNPGYAIAVNMDDTNNATVSFSSISGVPESGTLSVEWPVTVDTVGTETSLKSVFLEPLSGKIIKFDPKE